MVGGMQDSLNVNMNTIKLNICSVLFLCNTLLYAQDSLTASKVKLMPYYAAWGAHIEYSFQNLSIPLVYFHQICPYD
ncbi:MAG: hypothetical protein JWO44_957 [Bacteroidetes bacterium]|nr:hypothetical protein [Bacteroidota bacterium]